MTDTASPSIIPEEITKPRRTRERKPPTLPADQCPVLFSWAQAGLYMGCSADSARARYRRGDFGNLKVRKPVGWNGIMIIKAELDAALLEIANRSRLAPGEAG
jgi:hypothetical protein